MILMIYIMHLTYYMVYPGIIFIIYRIALINMIDKWLFKFVMINKQV